jgi:hypothetical protein
VLQRKINHVLQRKKIHLLLIAAALLVAAPARAQDHQPGPYSTSVYSEGPGFRLGAVPLAIHPGAIVELGYDSNVFYAPSQPVGSALLRLRAHLDLATLARDGDGATNATADPKVDFRLSAQLDYREYLTNNADVQAQRSLNLSLAAGLKVLPRGPFTLTVDEQFVRGVDPRNEEGPASFARDYDRLSLLASYRLGGGGLELGVGDYFQLAIWESGDLAFADVYSDEAQLYAKLRLFMQTFLSLTARVGYISYYNDPALEAVPVRVIAGATTMLTTWLGASAAIGYGNSLHLRGPRFSSVIANADVRFFLPSGARIDVGYDRDFFDSLFADFYVDDRLFVAFEQPFVRWVTARLDGGVRFRHYEGLIDPALIHALGYSSSARDDRVYDLRAELSLRPRAWLALTASYNFVADQTDFQILYTVGGNPLIAPTSYLKHSVFVRADFAY